MPAWSTRRCSRRSTPRLQFVAEHTRDTLIIDTTYLSASSAAPTRSHVHLTLSEGHSIEAEKAFYKAVADGLNARAGLRREEVVISLVEVKKENWSCGNGIAQYA